MIPINAKLMRNETYDGHWRKRPSPSEPADPDGTWTSKINNVMATAKTPSENASILPVSVGMGWTSIA
jgi:hypothetical protein